MTVAELGRRMSASEISEWRAHDELQAWRHEQAMKEAKTSKR